ncbi:MAG: cytochrome c [Bacteroidetes bacterium]|nr:cytochrome c [Bacteroidota bacterium]
MKISRSVLSIAMALSLTFTLQSCGGEANSESTSKAPESPKKEVKEDKVVVEDNQMALGEKIYMEKCIVCHQASGEGIPGAFPPLKNSDYLMADKVRAVAQVLNGSNKAIVVNGVTYTTPMPQQVNTKKEAVAVINYVLNAWGNDGGTVTLEEVKDVVIAPRE